MSLAKKKTKKTIRSDGWTLTELHLGDYELWERDDEWLVYDPDEGKWLYTYPKEQKECVKRF